MLPKGPYKSKDVEDEILKVWLEKGYYKPEYNPETDELKSLAEMKKDPREPWSLICPPPNAYGRPHIGNISGYAYQDAMARYQRMLGKKVLVLPGKDHAGLEGEGVFVREVLEKQKRYKFDMKREDFYNEMMDWMKENMAQALEDEKTIGLSADFDRNTFTLDPKIVKIVLDTFVKMHNEGMIYRGVRIINWDPKARSVLADNQVVREERVGHIHEIKYPVVNGRVWSINFRDLAQFNRIKSGDKTIETRALNPEEPERYFGDIKPGDIIVCKDKTLEKNLPIIKKVKSIKTYSDLADAFEKCDWKNALGVKVQSLEELTNIYADLAPGYAEKINKNGLYAVELEEFNIEGEESVTVATTRPETMFGDTAVAVNPKDKRYKNLIGKKVLIPLTERSVPIITSRRVEKDFGTGALKITPAHAADDFTIMNEWNEDVMLSLSKHEKKEEKSTLRPPQGDNLEDEHNVVNKNKISYINIINKRLELVGPVPEKYKNQKYKQVKDQIIDDLKSEGYLVKSEEIKQNVQLSERTKALVEPIMSSQWYVNVESLKKPVMDMVKKSKTKIHPKNMEKAFFNWMENLQDWAISRSLWWGYRLPVWYAGEIEEKIDDEGKVHVMLNLSQHEEKEEESTLRSHHEDILSEGAVTSPRPHKNNDDNLVPLDPTNPNHMRVQLESPGEGWIQDEDVLDTWFSSGQWPFATLMIHDLLDEFYPTNVMETGFDILENWVSRMMMFSHIRMQDIPFRDVYLHGLVKGTDGQKMSKSKGNLINIDDVREKYGTDAVRMVYFYQNSAGSDYAMTYDKLDGFKKFINKVWNASKFVLMNLEDLKETEVYDLDENDLKLKNSKRILKHTKETKERVLKNIESFDFGLATFNIHNEFWHTFCDVFLEESKPYVYTQKDRETGEIISEPDKLEKKETQKVLLFALKTYLKLMHPFIPFVTERIWKEIPKEQGDHETLMYSKI